jgi:hypothetical protein
MKIILEMRIPIDVWNILINYLPLKTEFIRIPVYFKSIRKDSIKMIYIDNNQAKNESSIYFTVDFQKEKLKYNVYKDTASAIIVYNKLMTEVFTEHNIE